MNNFYADKRVLVTGHTGFKGTWLTKILVHMGAKVCGYSLKPNSEQMLFEQSHVDTKINNVYGDIRDYDKLRKIFIDFCPEIVFHLAAQPLVRDSYKEPRYTYDVNVMGTVNLLECIRTTDSVKSVLNVTTDKVYKNNEWEWGYRENEPLDGYDPYSNSKSCSELVTHSYINSFFKSRDVSISTARAGNVIGGGDFSKNRIIPDCVRSVTNNMAIEVRNPNSIRPYQHVLEPLSAYMNIAEKQWMDKEYADFYNVGPNESDCITTGELATLFCLYWGKESEWKQICQDGPHEANFLKLDCSKIKSKLGWKPKWDVKKAVENTIELYKCIYNSGNISACMDKQIEDYFEF